jgi:hypothetical protein
MSRLSEDLSSLGRRLCEGIAVLVGRHAGEAVRDTVEAALGQTRTDDVLPGPSDRSYPGGRDNAYRESYRDPYVDDRDGRYGDYPRDSDPWSGSEYEPVPSRSSPGPAYPPAWWSVLPPVLQVLNWWLRQRESRQPLAAALGVAAAAVLASLAVSPVAGLLVASAGTALTLSGLITGLRDVVGELASG